MLEERVLVRPPVTRSDEHRRELAATNVLPRRLRIHAGPHRCEARLAMLRHLFHQLPHLLTAPWSAAADHGAGRSARFRMGRCNCRPSGSVTVAQQWYCISEFAEAMKRACWASGERSSFFGGTIHSSCGYSERSVPRIPSIDMPTHRPGWGGGCLENVCSALLDCAQRSQRLTPRRSGRSSRLVL